MRLTTTTLDPREVNSAIGCLQKFWLRFGSLEQRLIKLLEELGLSDDQIREILKYEEPLGVYQNVRTRRLASGEKKKELTGYRLSLGVKPLKHLKELSDNLLEAVDLYKRLREFKILLDKAKTFCDTK